MRNKSIIIVIVTIMTLSANAQSDPKTNPLLMEWNTPFQTPPFDLIKTEHYLPAFEYAIKDAKNEISFIRAIKAPATFENTIVALERSGQLLSRVSGVFFNMIGANTSPELQKVAQKVSPMLTEYSNDLYLDEALFARVKAVHDKPGSLNEEQKMLLDKTYRNFIKSGANLTGGEKEMFRDISMKLSVLSLKFSENVLNATNTYAKNITDKALVAGIPAGELAIAKEKAKAKKLKGWVFDLSQPSYLAVMKYADNRELRKELYLNYNSKAFQDANDNTQVILEMMQLKRDMVKLLGFENYATYVLQDRMAENPKNVFNFLNELLDYSYPVAQKEIADLTKFANSVGFNEEIQRWDFSYYSEKQKTSLFNVSDEMLKPYFKLENVIEGVFNLVNTLFDLKFIENSNIPVYHPDVKAYEVYRNDGKFMAVLYLDFHPRDSKRGGAWMTSFREQRVDASGNDIRPFVSLVMNFTPSTKKSPSLLTFYEVRTFLHEFGHALHGMLSQVNYESLSGTNVPRDFVELPSQLLENWSVEKDFLDKFAFHYQTKQVIPRELIKKIQEIDNFQAGYAFCRQLTFGFLDMMWHTTSPDVIDNVLLFERDAIKKTELLPVVDGTCMSTAFSHIFSGGYSAGYYGYKWAEVLDADAFSLFQEKGIFNPDVAKSYVENILSRGGSKNPMELYINFRGREPKIDALLIRSGLK